MRSVLVGVGLMIVGCVGCEETPPAAQPQQQQQVHLEEKAPKKRSAPPPLPVKADEAFYIVAIPKAVTAPAVAVCNSNSACNEMLPPDPPNIVRRFDQEAWVVIDVPAGFDAKNCISDGTTATARVEASSSTESKIVLYRVAPTVTQAKLSGP